MPPDSSDSLHPNTRHEVAKKYGYPWPWRVDQLVEEHAVERDMDLRDLAEEWGVSSKMLFDWVRRHGYRVEDFRAKR